MAKTASSYKRRFFCFFCMLIFGVLGCEDRDSIWERQIRIDGPHAAGEKLVWLDRTTSRLLVWEAGSESGAESVDLLKTPRSMALAAGRVVVAGGSGSDPAIEIVDLNDNSVLQLELEEAYDRVFVAPGNRHAVLTHAMDDAATGGPAARNFNRIAIAKLTGTARITEILLQTESLAPREVVFSNDGAYAAVVLDSAIAIVDLVQPLRYLRVPLRLSGGQNLIPRQVLFSPEADYLYVRSSGTPDLLVIEIADEEALSATLNFLFVPGARSVESFLVPSGEEYRQHVAALFKRDNDSVAALLHASGDASLSKQVVLSRPATRLLEIEDGCMIIHGVAVAGAFSRWIAGWEIDSGRVDQREVQGEYKAEPLVVDGQVFFRHDSVSVPDIGVVPAVTGVRVDRSGAWLRVRASAVVLRGPPTAAFAGDDGNYFLGVNIDRSESGAAADLYGRMTAKTGALVMISGEMMNIDGVVFDDSIKDLGVVGDYVYAMHDRILGDLTIVPRNDLSRESSWRYDGLFLSGLLDTTEERQ